MIFFCIADVRSSILAGICKCYSTTTIQMQLTCIDLTFELLTSNRIAHFIVFAVIERSHDDQLPIDIVPYILYAL